MNVCILKRLVEDLAKQCLGVGKYYSSSSCTIIVTTDRLGPKFNKDRYNQDLRTTPLSPEAVIALKAGYRQQKKAAAGWVSQSLFKGLQFSGNSARTAVIVERLYQLR